MGRKTKKFIDKKRDVTHTFKVVQRSQKDPLVADETAPQGVLVDAPSNEEHAEELNEYGIYFDDEYDYLQHLRGVKEAIDWEECDVEVYTIRNEDPKRSKNSHKNIGLVLPSSAFESFVEEPIGLLNKAAPVTGPQPDLDPDIVAILDDDDLEGGDIFSPDDAEGLPDDFVSLLNAEDSPEETYHKGEFDGIERWLGQTEDYSDMPQLEGSYGEARFSNYKMNRESNSDDEHDSNSDFFVSADEEDDEVGSLPDFCPFVKRGPKTDARSRTSASSATVPRTELLTILDERFERLFNQDYTDDQIGALDGEVIEGPLDVNSEVFQQAYQATLKQLRKYRLNDADGDDKDRIVEWVKENMGSRLDLPDNEEEVIVAEMKVKPKFDCESILSLYSNTENLPHLIDDSHLWKKKKSSLTKRAIREHNKDGDLDNDEKDMETVTILTCISAISNRPKDETPDERRDRKNALKELRKERRKEKKINKLSFKEELKLQKKIHMNKPKSRIVQVF